MEADARYKVSVPDNGHWRRQIRCQTACPVHTDARGYIRAISEGDIEGAYLIARGPNPLASICGRICGAPCELNCRRGSLDKPVSIRALKRYASTHHGVEDQGRELALVKRLSEAFENAACAGEEELGALISLVENGRFERASGQKIAIIGAGPAGLAAAHDLALLGFKPVIFEMESVPAGMLYLGVPEYRLPRDLIESEVSMIQAMGVEIKTGVSIGQDITLPELMKCFDAVIVAVGAKKCRTLPIKGAEGKGVIGGVDFLRAVALSWTVEVGRTIVVIGGGNVAYDVSRTAIRHDGEYEQPSTPEAQLHHEVADDVSRMALRQTGVRTVHLCCLESREEMLADTVEILEGAEEGVILHNSVGPDEILLDDSGAVRGVRFKKVLSVYDEDGRFAPVFDDASTTEIEADSVLVAIGQQCDFSFLDPARDQVEVTKTGALVLDENQATTRPGLFAAGDAAHGTKLMIHAIASGKQVARSVYEYVMGTALELEETALHVPLPGYTRRPRFESIQRQIPPAATAEQRKSSITMEVELCYDSETAFAEAERCLDCGVNTIFDGNKCILCGGCVDVCPEQCLKLVSLERLLGDDRFEALKANRILEGPALMSAIIKNDTRCTRCAVCVERCPVNAISMERFNFSYLGDREKAHV